MKRVILLGALLATAIASTPIKPAFANEQDDAAAMAIIGGLAAGAMMGAMRHHHPHYYYNPYYGPGYGNPYYGPGFGPRMCWPEQRPIFWNGYFVGNRVVRVCQ